MKLCWRIILLAMLPANAWAQKPATPSGSPVSLPSSSPNAVKKFVSPPYQNLRYDENYEYLRDESKRVDALDKLKFIAFKKDKSWYLSLGGEVRPRFEIFGDASFGAGMQDANGFFEQRYMFHADFHFGKRLRVFAQIKSGFINNRNGGARNNDLDKLDVNQGFADVRLFGDDKKSVILRVGRQEVEFGSSRLISTREGLNVRQTFDGARILIKIGKWQISPFFLKPVINQRGYFDDNFNNEQTLFGGYAARNLKKINGLAVVYFNEFDRKQVVFGQGAGRERRDTLGARIAGKLGAFDFNYEIIGQFGEFASVPIRAYGIVTDNGYKFEKARFAPRIAFRADSTSGNKNPRDNKLQTFNPLFAPAVAYGGLVNLLIPSNSTALIPSLELSFPHRVSFKIDDALFWRTSSHDALYAVGAAQRSGQSSRAKFVGNQPSAQIVWRINRHWSATTVYTHFSAGRFLRETPPAKNVDYFTSYLTFKF